MFPHECLATIERVPGEVLYFVEFAGIREGIGVTFS